MIATPNISYLVVEFGVLWVRRLHTWAECDLLHHRGTLQRPLVISPDLTFHKELNLGY